MRRAVAAAVVFALPLTLVPAPVRAGTSTDVALGLASFAVFNQVVEPFLRGGGGFGGGGVRHRHVVHHQTIVTQPAVVYAAPPAVVYAAPPPVVLAPAPVVAAPPVVAAAPSPTVVQYPHGRYELRWSGAQYTWVWIPTVPPPPPPPPAAAPPPPPAPPAP